MADKKKMSTQEILAKLRADAGKKKVESDDDTSASGTETAESGSEKKQPAAGKPKSTADILAAAREQATGGGSEAAAPKKPAASAGKPKSTADILAAARAQSGKGAGSAKPAAEAKGPSQAAAGGGGERGGETPSVKEMLDTFRADRTGKPAVEPGAEVTAPPMPKRPEPVKPRGAAPQLAPETRRGVLLWLLLLIPFAITSLHMAWVLLVGSIAAMTLGTVRFMLPNVLVEPPSRFKIGPPSDFDPETVATKYKAERGIWLVRTSRYNGQDLLVALASVCTHLGCTPNWLEAERKFKCPCHGSGFYIDGVNFEGPAPRPLERMAIRLDPADGMLEVDKSRKFQEEMGQWEDGSSYHEMV